MFSWNQIILLIAPWLLLATTYLCYQLLMRRFGAKKAYLGGFLFYWVVWCLLFPLALLGPQAIIHLFRSVPSPFGQPWWLGAFCLIGPPVVAYVFIFPKALQKASVTIVLVSAALAIVNGPLEELLWRGAYITLFPGQLWLALLYPTIGFALWHFAPQSIFPYKGPGGRVTLVVEVWFLGLLWAWVANNTGVILWTAIAHILIDFSALGWVVLFT
jgi:CAAX protease family protein